jgi:hypothetical protein
MDGKHRWLMVEMQVYGACEQVLRVGFCLLGLHTKQESEARAGGIDEQDLSSLYGRPTL